MVEKQKKPHIKFYTEFGKKKFAKYGAMTDQEFKKYFASEFPKICDKLKKHDVEHMILVRSEG